MISIARVWRALYNEDVTTGRRSAPMQYKVVCPFHADKHPSCDVNVDKNVFYCRSCGANGGVFALVQKELRLNREAARVWIHVHCR